LARRAIRAALETRIALAAFATGGDQYALFVLDNLADEFAGFLGEHPRAAGHRDFDVAASRAGPVLARPTDAMSGAEFSLRLEIRKRIDPLVADEPDVAAVATVAAIGPTARYIFLAAKTDAARPAVAGLYLDDGFVYEFHDWASLSALGVAPRRIDCVSKYTQIWPPRRLSIPGHQKNPAAAGFF
jgi:hypothetical protein